MRRGLGRGRSLIAVGAVLALISMPLPWQKAGGIVLEVETAWGFAGTGRVMFVAALAMLALLLAPFATRTGEFVLDRPLAYVILLGAGIVALLGAIVDLVAGDAEYGLGPLDAPGLWLAIVAMAMATWGVLELIAEQPRAP